MWDFDIVLGVFRISRWLVEKLERTSAEFDWQLSLGDGTGSGMQKVPAGNL